MLDSADVEDEFVTVNLDSSRCDICHLDTGEDLVPCGICQQEIANAGHNRTGFNELPAHSDMQAHKGCLWKEHQISSMQFSPVQSPVCSSPTVSPARSPSSGSLFDLMTGGNTSPHRMRSVSQPATPQNMQSPLPKHRRFTVIGGPVPEDDLSQKSKSYDELNKDAFNSKLQKLLRKAKNKELFENKRNDTSMTVHSSPNTRCSSPMLINNESDKPIHKSRSDKNLKESVQKEADPKYIALKQSYAKYLFGKSIFSRPRDIFGGRRKQSAPQSPTQSPTTPNTTVVDSSKPGTPFKSNNTTEFEVRLHPIDADKQKDKQRTSSKTEGNKKKSFIVGRRDVKPDIGNGRTSHYNNNNGKTKERSKSVPMGLSTLTLSQFRDARNAKSRQSSPTVLVIDEEPKRDKEDRKFKIIFNLNAS